MNQMELLNDIIRYLGIFQEQVKISTSNNQYDINIHSENVLIPIFNKIFDGNFENLNYLQKNAEAIDLLDYKSGIAIQVTASRQLAKIKSTLEKLFDSEHKKHVKQLYIYILTERQPSYNGTAIAKIIGKRLTFDIKKNIWDARDLYKRVQSFTDIDSIKDVKELLRMQFSELYLSETLTKSGFEKIKAAYSKTCLTNFSRLNFFGLSVQRKPREVDLYNLFVQPKFTKSSTYDFETIDVIKSMKTDITLPWKIGKELPINDVFLNTTHKIRLLSTIWDNKLDTEFSEILSHQKHLAILGNPGAGKSSIVKYAICKILENDQTVFSYKQIYEFFPLRVELHKYNQAKNERKLGIIGYIEQLLAEEYQTTISQSDFKQLLKHQQVILFFDGMDEIFDIQQRIGVRNDIESIVKLYPHMRSVVTSRFESYSEVSLDKKLFKALEVKSFSDDEIKEYVGKWYSLEESSVKVRQHETADCIKKLQDVDNELKCNPLLLSLILILYRNELEIPTSKLEIYENCTNTIVDHRDSKEKKLMIHLKISNAVGIFSALGHWQFENDMKQLPISSEDVFKFIKNHLIIKGEFSDDRQASQSAEEFLEFAKVRSIYFENKFTHKTFLEYFTAYYLFSQYYSKPQNHNALLEVISKNIGLSSWAVVLELLVCKIDSGQIDFEIIDSIITDQFKKNPIQATIFFVSIIRYIKNISPNLSLHLITASLLQLASDEFENKSQEDDKEILFNHIVAIHKLPRFHGQINNAFESLIKLDNLNQENLVIFALEYSYITIQADHSMQKSYQETIAGAMYGLKLGPELEKPDYVLHGGLFLRWNDALIPVVKLDHAGFSFAFSYDANISKLKPASL
ncbi:MAG: NACHT domain-containing protein, partial [Pedobacter sp.]